MINSNFPLFIQVTGDPSQESSTIRPSSKEPSTWRRTRTRVNKFKENLSTLNLWRLTNKNDLLDTNFRNRVRTKDVDELLKWSRRFSADFKLSWMLFLLFKNSTTTPTFLGLNLKQFIISMREIYSCFKTLSLYKSRNKFDLILFSCEQFFCDHQSHS